MIRIDAYTERFLYFLVCLMVGIGLGIACDDRTVAQQSPPPPAMTLLYTGFVRAGRETFAGRRDIRIDVLRHQSGACFVVIDTGGEGSGGITQADRAVCAAHVAALESATVHETREDR